MNIWLMVTITLVLFLATCVSCCFIANEFSDTSIRITVGLGIAMIISIIVTAIGIIGIHHTDDYQVLETYALMESDDGYTAVTSGTVYTTRIIGKMPIMSYYTNTKLNVSYMDKDGDVQFVDIKDANSRVKLEKGEDKPYVEVIEYEFLFFTYQKELVHINID